MTTRRDLLIALGAGTVAAPFACLAQQQGKVWRIGYLVAPGPSAYTPWINGFKAGMSALGYAEGRDYAMEIRSAQSDLARLPALAAELVALKVDVILTSGTSSPLAASKATREIPILTTTASDPVGSGLAATLARPGGNVTGFTQLLLGSKRLDLLRQLLPRMKRVGLLYDPGQNGASALAGFESDCSKLQLQPIRTPASKAEDIPVAFKILARNKAQGLLVVSGATNIASRASIIEQALKQRLPVIYGESSYVEAGGLISYAPDYPDLYRRAAAYADKIFKGAKPGDLPIQQPVTFEFVLNLRTAKALGLMIPQSILVQATKVIE